MQLFDKPEPHRFGIKSLRGQEHDRKIRCARGIYVFFLYILRAFQKNFTQVFLRSGNILAGIIRIAEFGINIRREFAVNGKVNRFSAVIRKFYCKFNALIILFSGVKITFVLFRRKNLAENCAELNFAERAACFDI